MENVKISQMLLLVVSVRTNNGPDIALQQATALCDEMEYWSIRAHLPNILQLAEQGVFWACFMNIMRTLSANVVGQDERVIFLVSYVGKRPWWPIQCLNKGRKKKAKG